MPRNSTANLESFDRRLASMRKFAAAATQARPEIGWVSALRRALGISMAVLGKRLGTSAVAVHYLETAEKRGAITLASLQRVADALDADLVYALIPRRPLRETLRARARIIATERVRAVAHTMALEKQELSDRHIRKQIESSVNELIARPKDLWR